MDTCLPEWNTEVEVELPVPGQRKPLGVSKGLVELLCQSEEVVLHSQNHRKPTYDTAKSKKVHKPDQSTSRASTNLNNLIQDDETVSWIHSPIDESFEKEFFANLLSDIPSPNLVEANKVSGQFEGVDFFKFGASDVNHVFPSSQRPDFVPTSLPPSRFEAFDSAHQHQNLEGIRKTGNLQLPVKRQGFNQMAHGEICKCSVMRIGSNHCGSNQVAINDVDISQESSCAIGSTSLSAGVDKNYAQKVAPQSESNETGTLEQAITSSGGSDSSFCKTRMHSNDTNKQKRKIRDVEESECQSDATQLEAAGNKSSLKSGMTRRSRVPEVHNLSERRRRDRINEKMRALQELIPHSNKSGKASILDEAIHYMKSLQLQLQLMWMRSGMAQMMLPGMQHYMSRIGMGIGPPMLPPIQNLLRPSRLPLVDQAITIAPTPNQATIGQSLVWNPVNYQNQMQSPSVPEQYANYMGFHAMQNTSQLMNTFNFGSHSTQQTHVLARLSDGHGSMG
ncbi:hypothetical protein Pfo_022239 [Paulownia fortunei]|nr:hypothetical protein Pfo_022239 [Paulownia fortunei]